VVYLNDNLIKIINLARQKLKENSQSIMFGDLANGVELIHDNFNCPIYCEFLKVCNGASCGDIDFWSTKYLMKNQFYLVNMRGGQDTWLCIGQVLYEPLMLNKQDEKVYLFRKDELDGAPIFCFESFNDLIENYVFGERYRDIVKNVENDEWYIFLKENNFFQPIIKGNRLT